MEIAPELAREALAAELGRERLAMMPADTVAALRADGGRAFLAQRQQELLSTFGAPMIVPFAQDITGLSNRAADARAHVGRIDLDPSTGLLTTTADGADWALVRATMRGDSFRLGDAERVVGALDAQRAAVAAKGGALIAAGGALHAVAAREQAESEISTVGVLSMLGTMALIALAFRRVRALVAILPALFGLVAGVVGTVAVFGTIHTLTIVLGTSLIGVSVDYGLHYMSEAFTPGEPWHPWRAMARVRTPLALGLLTSLIGYAAIGLAPFPALRQLSVFSAVGLLAAFLAVVMAMPAALGRFGAGGDTLLLRAGRVLLGLRERVRGPRAWMAGAALAALLVPGVLRLSTSDDVRALVYVPPALRDEGARVQELSGVKVSSAFFLVEGATADEALSRQAALAKRLHAEVAADAVAGFVALGEAWHAEAAQEETRRVVLDTLFSEASVRWWVDTLGVDAAVVEANRAALQAAPRVDVESFLAGPLGAPYRALWIGPTARGFAGVVQVNDVRDAGRLASIALEVPGTRWVDRVAEVSRVMGDTRRLAGWLTVGACVLMCVVLMPRYGVTDAVRVIAAPVAGVLGALSAMGWMGMPLNMFGVFGLVLVLATGVDYAIYFREAQHDPGSTMLGVLLDTLTTLLSFGVLVVSRTPAVQSFGASVALGIVLCFLLAPWARAPRITA